MGQEIRVMRSLAFNTRLNGVGAATLNITQKNNYAKYAFDLCIWAQPMYISFILEQIEGNVKWIQEVNKLEKSM